MVMSLWLTADGIAYVLSFYWEQIRIKHKSLYEVKKIVMTMIFPLPLSFIIIFSFAVDTLRVLS